MNKAKQVISFLLVLFLIHSSGFFAFADDYIGLQLDSSGREVYELQKRLTELGYNTNGIDGWYGEDTKSAVKAFQYRNGLNDTGIATVKMQEALYSDDAKGVFIPNIDIISVSFDGESSSVYLKNKTDKTVDSLVFYIYTFDQSGNLITENRSIDHARMPGTYSVSISPIASGNTGYAYIKIDSDVLIPYLKLDTVIKIGSSVKTIGIAIKSYHTADGNHYEYSDNQLLIKKSDGLTIQPKGDSEPDIMSDEQMQKAKEVLFGYYCIPITSDVAPLYHLRSVGNWVNKVIENCIADKAGLLVKDVLTAIDDEPVGNAHAVERAKLRMLNGEEVTVHYLRDNKEYTTVVSLDSDSIGKEASAD